MDGVGNAIHYCQWIHGRAPGKQLKSWRCYIRVGNERSIIFSNAEDLTPTWENNWLENLISDTGAEYSPHALQHIAPRIFSSRYNLSTTHSKIQQGRQRPALPLSQNNCIVRFPRCKTLLTYISSTYEIISRSMPVSLMVYPTSCPNVQVLVLP
jgi:hypothetical protein